ncbi:hypothetical protein, partial [Streptomyces sp. NPDC056056]|uniref:hypothetical protein n=1 Tax=Streptomyces sp. NPDC056056 TaxID=3345698 RepID=UPI0035D89F3E
MITTALRRRTQHTDQLTSGALASRVEAAHSRLAHQDDPALLQALSERELAARRDLAERGRDIARREELARVETAAAAAERLRRTVSQLADQEADDLVTAQRVLVEQRRRRSPHARLAWLDRRRSLVLRILTTLVVFAMLFSAVTVQQNIAPHGGVTNPMFWLSYGLEALISGMLIAIMITDSDTTAGNSDRRDSSRSTARIAEVVLLMVTLGLNTYPYFRAGDAYGVAVHSIAPVMIGVALLIHDYAAQRYNHTIDSVTASITGVESDIAARLAELTQMTTSTVEQQASPSAVAIDSVRADLPAIGAPNHEAATMPSSSPALEQARPAVVRDDASRTPQREPRTGAGTAGPAPV